MARYLVSFLMCAIIVSFPLAGFAEQKEATEDTEYGYGTVVEVQKDASKIVVKEYDWDADEEVEVTYSISEAAEIENIDSWKNIPNGTYVDIEYVTSEKGEKVVSYINVYEPEEEE